MVGWTVLSWHATSRCVTGMSRAEWLEVDVVPAD